MKYFKSLVKHNFPLQRDCEIFFFLLLFEDEKVFSHRDLRRLSFFCRATEKMLRWDHHHHQHSSRKPMFVQKTKSDCSLPNTWLWNYVRASRRYKSQHEIQFFSPRQTCSYFARLSVMCDGAPRLTVGDAKVLFYDRCISHTRPDENSIRSHTPGPSGEGRKRSEGPEEVTKNGNMY